MTDTAIERMAAMLWRMHGKPHSDFFTWEQALQRPSVLSAERAERYRQQARGLDVPIARLYASLR